MLAAIPEARRDKLQGQDIDELLAPEGSPLFFLDLINIVKREWDIFSRAFDFGKDKTILMLQEINDLGRPDAHAGAMSDDDFSQVRLHFKKLETAVAEWT